ncbi:tetratricopeptide repeat protein [Streptomyces sp. SudanB52_2052]|uniref:tetratricopeptide repeat protein n=1 Tax=Streptomyces sp. SudanB52_2052 TaxID=3035276 RepID=UPI003F577EF9
MRVTDRDERADGTPPRDAPGAEGPGAAGAPSRAPLGADGSPDPTAPDPGALQPLDALDAVLLVSRARELARSGDPGGALELLRNHEHLGGHRDVLDLRARLHAQRGETAEAAECWRRVLARRPDDPEARAGLARLGRTGPAAALGRHRTRTALVAAVCVVTAAVTGVVTALDEPARTDTDRAAGPETPGTRATPAPGRQRDPDEARRATALASLARDLRAPGLRVTTRADSVEVAFTEGLFSEGTRLTPTGAQRLAELGERLAGQESAITVHGHAAVVPGAPRSGGSVVALWRALVAARELSTATGKPLTAFTTDSADQRDAPYPDDPARNRTVTVVLTPR